jgi:hypothetical protein
MGLCKYCGEKAGLFRSKHKACEVQKIAGQTSIIQEVEQFILHKDEFENLKSKVQQIASENFIPIEELNALYGKGFDQAVNQILEDGVITEEEESKIGNFKAQFEDFDTKIDTNDSILKVIKSLILRDLLNGNLPKSRINYVGTVPFLIQKGEEFLWVFTNVAYHERVNKTVFVGRSQGVSVRIAKGIYYRTSSFKGNPVVTNELRYISTGILAFTNKHVWFSSDKKSFKIPYTKLVTIEPFDDGCGLLKDGVSAKPQIFSNIDGWFTYNLVSNMVSLV